jgi:hypothetical protein
VAAFVQTTKREFLGGGLSDLRTRLLDCVREPPILEAVGGRHQPLGSTVRQFGERPILVSVAGKSPIASIEIVHNDETIQTYRAPTVDA